MRARSLLVLMWKHVVVRYRKYIHTGVELLAPLLLFILLFALRKQINPPKISSRSDMSFLANTEVLDLIKDTEEQPGNILYYPDTNLTAVIMDEVGDNMGLRRLDRMPNDRNKGYFAYSKYTPIMKFINKMEIGDAIVIFEDMDGEVWPKKLNYTIQMKQNFQTHGYLPPDQGPHAMFGLNYMKFMRLQWAIDTAYIKLRSGTPVEQEVYAQEFPFYKSEKFSNMALITTLIKICCYLSLLLPFVFLMTRLLEERASGIQELVKMVGVSLNTLGLSHFLNVLPTMLVFAFVVSLFLTLTAHPFLPHCNGFLIFLFLLLYFNSITSLAFVCSYVVMNSEYGVTIAVLLYWILWLPSYLVAGHCNSLTPKLLIIVSGMLPHRPMMWFWNNVAALETLGTGVSFSNMFWSGKPCNSSVFNCYLFLLLQTTLCYGLTWYLARVRHGKYGQPLPWNFIFKKQYWTKKNEVEPDLDSDELELMQRDEQYFEKPPDNMKIGIKVEDVSKVYPQLVALKNVSLNVYQGEITVLLGHNGAGKTTLMSIITGMTGATKGKVYVNDMDTVTQQEQVRKNIGLCPQHNIFFADLTLQQHIMFFTMLKHGTYEEARVSSRALAHQLGLEDKLHDMCSSLSGGMRRRAQLACALAGGADVLVLDEPTSGLDVESRRELWDLLLSLRGSRTVLLSTHFMEEADALGDRVAALHNGELRCFATTMYLKRAVGDGYRLSLTTIGLPKESAITRAVMSHVPDATLKEKTINSISYSLPASANDKFPNLFTELESQRSKLRIDSIGVGISTLEEVFLKLCSDVVTKVEEEEVRAITPNKKHKRLTGFPLYLRQFAILFKRQIKFVLFRKWIFLVLQILIPILLICLITRESNDSKKEHDPTLLKMDLDIYSDMPDRRVLYNMNIDNNIRQRSFDDMYSGVKFERTDENIADYVGRIGKNSSDKYMKYLVGIEQVNNNSAKILYTTTVRHAAAVALNLLTNLLAAKYLQPPPQITTYNKPVQGYVRDDIYIMIKTPNDVIFYALSITFFVLATNLHCASLPCRERETGSRHIHIMSGCPSELYWATTLVFHMTLVFLFLVVPIVLAILSFEEDGTIDYPEFMLAYAVLILVGSLTLFAFVYLTSFYCNERYTNMIQIAILFVFGLVLPLFRNGLDMLEATGYTSSGYFVIFLSLCWYIMPPYTMMMTALGMVKTASINAFCYAIRDDCPDLFVQEPGWWNDAHEARCCAGLTAKPYWSTEKNAPMLGIIALLIQFLVLMTMVMMTQRGIFNNLCDSILNKQYQPVRKDDADQNVRAETTYVQREIAKRTNDIKKDAILVSDVHKNYRTILMKNCNAVKGINFSVKKGECFGLLGVNGAGKSTTFKMLTASECVTRGKIFGNGHRLTRGNTQYLQTLGYCPQFFGLDMFLTGRENLNLVLTLRGYKKKHVKAEVESWISIVGLDKYANRRVETYSGGCLRRLGAASALCGGASVALLDEPSAGVDVAARRRLWAALRKALKERRAVIITSHSMDEMESLCGRIAIMCAGRVRALGTPLALRSQFAAGHAVMLKVKQTSGDEVDNAKSEINELKGKLQETFNCNLKDEHKTMLHYHINETMRYSDLFAQLEALKAQFPHLIEDYSVTETTLEEVFLSLAEETKNEQQRV